MSSVQPIEVAVRSQDQLLRQDVQKLSRFKQKRVLRALQEDESGMSTAEYAVGTVAAAGLGGVLIKLLSSPEVQALLWSVIQKAFSWLT